jgi:hypothetical protein
VSGRKAHSAVCRTWASGPPGYETPSEARDCYNVADTSGDTGAT